jgi:hypothetical protein
MTVFAVPTAEEMELLRESVFLVHPLQTFESGPDFRPGNDLAICRRCGGTAGSQHSYVGGFCYTTSLVWQATQRQPRRYGPYRPIAKALP